MKGGDAKSYAGSFSDRCGMSILSPLKDQPCRSPIMGVITMVKKGVPKRDGSGKGKRLNRGRGGCATTQKKGKGHAK